MTLAHIVRDRVQSTIKALNFYPTVILAINVNSEPEECLKIMSKFLVLGRVKGGHTERQHPEALNF